MKISYNWLREYVDLSGLKTDEIADILTHTGLEVESVDTHESVKGGLEGLVIGEVISLKKHENADKLKVAEVDVAGENYLQIVCGASNIEKGQKVVVAKPGTTLYPLKGDPFVIKEAEIRGVKSFGMICAEDEIGIGESHDGIIVLEKKVQTGLPAAEYYKISNDSVFEIGLTPNRTDAMSHIGVARDLLTYLNFHHKKKGALSIPEVQQIEESSKPSFSVAIEDADLCPDYRMVKIQGVEVKPSPEWLASRLKAIGIQPKNNIVDVTNFVMHECGHPLHAFDGDVLGSSVIIRRANKGEVLVTLDGLERKLSEEDLLIAGDKKPMCIAGVMGGEKSGVHQGTRTVCLESAFFSPASIRKSAKRHNIHSDASFRFERGADPEILDWALRRATNLILEISGGEIEGGIVKVNPDTYKRVTIKFNPSKCREIIGKSISNEEMAVILENLGTKITGELAEGSWTVEVPGFKADVVKEIDLIEEVLRIYGLNRVEVPQKMSFTPISNAKKPSYIIKSEVQHLLSGAGWFEIMNNSLTGTSDYHDIRSFNADEFVRIKNPLSNELDIMRPSLLMGGLNTLAYNINRKESDLRLFEFGKIYRKDVKSGFKESEHLGLWMTGDEQKLSWKPSVEKDFFDVKTVIESISDISGLDFTYEMFESDIFSAAIKVSHNSKHLGEAGIVHPKILAKKDIKQAVYFAFLDWTAILSAKQSGKIVYKPLPKTLPVKRDYSILIDEHISFDLIKQTLLKKSKGEWLKKIHLFDVYEGKNIPKGKKSYALSFILQDENKTLKDSEIDDKMKEIWDVLEKDFKASLR